MKELCNQSASDSFDMQIAQQLSDRCNSSDDLREGMLAAGEKRAPVFTNT